MYAPVEAERLIVGGHSSGWIFWLLIFNYMM
jgi:hypothetical protein